MSRDSEKLYKHFARTLEWYLNLDKDHRYKSVADRRLEKLHEHLPSGSGLDSGPPKLDIQASKPNRLIFHGEYHHMDGESGMYAGWFQFKVTITASLAWGYDMRFVITGNDTDLTKKDLAWLYKDLLMEDIGYALDCEVVL